MANNQQRGHFMAYPKNVKFKRNPVSGKIMLLQYKKEIIIMILFFFINHISLDASSVIYKNIFRGRGNSKLSTY